jgi:hypothetical protein
MGNWIEFRKEKSRDIENMQIIKNNSEMDSTLKRTIHEIHSDGFKTISKRYLQSSLIQS